jgi:site-specific DNA-methyltransferase (adenine-specific)
MTIPFPTGKWDIIYIDPPWRYYRGDTKGQYTDYSGAAEKHYPTMSEEEICALPMRSIMSDTSVVFMWATGPMLASAIRVIDAWDLWYRGVTYVWVKTKQDGGLMGAFGTIPTFTKPKTEFVLAATINKRARPFPITTIKQDQLVFAPRGRHSEKPDEVRRRIVELCGDRSRIELFARVRSAGWDAWGNEVPPEGGTTEVTDAGNVVLEGNGVHDLPSAGSMRGELHPSATSGRGQDDLRGVREGGGQEGAGEPAVEG